MDADGWVKIITAVFAGLGTLGTLIIGFMQWWLSRKVSKNDVKATAARASLSAKVDQAAVKVAEVHAEAKEIKVQTDGMNQRLEAAALTQGRTEGKAEEKANPS